MKLPLMSAAFVATALFAAPVFAQTAAPAATPAPAAEAPAPAADAGTMAPKKATKHHTSKHASHKKAKAAEATPDAPKK
jgi:hypothetical protein